MGLLESGTELFDREGGGGGLIERIRYSVCHSYLVLVQRTLIIVVCFIIKEMKGD